MNDDEEEQQQQWAGFIWTRAAYDAKGGNFPQTLVCRGKLNLLLLTLGERTPTAKH